MDFSGTWPSKYKCFPEAEPAFLSIFPSSEENRNQCDIFYSGSTVAA